MSICGEKVIIKATGEAAYCTHTDGNNVRVTLVNDDPLSSVNLVYDEVRLLTVDDCQCYDENSLPLNQCNECPR